MKMQTTLPKLYRSADDVIVAGVCAGVADFFGLETGKVRLATLLLVCAGGLSLWVYLLLWLVVPRGRKRLEEHKNYG